MLRTLSFEQMPPMRSGLASPRRVSPLVLPFAAVVEGLVASRQYQQLRSRGCSHDAAVREAVGIGPAREQRVGSICLPARPNGWSTGALRGRRAKLTQLLRIIGSLR